MKLSVPGGLGFSLLLFASIPARAFDASDRLVVPTERVGAVSEATSESDLAAVYGSSSITHIRAADGGTEATVLFAGTPAEVEIEWKAADRSPRRIVIIGGEWKTPEGLAVGSTLQELEKINGGPFDVTGANWDRPVRAVSWKGGHLPPTLQVDFQPAKPDARLPKKLRSARTFFESTEPVLRNSHLVVKRLILEW